MLLPTGGQPPTWDIPCSNESGATVTVGDWMVLDLDTERDGYGAIKPVIANDKDFKSFKGVVIGKSGQTFLDTQDMFVRVYGYVPEMKVESTQDIVIEDTLFLVTAQHYAITVATQPDFDVTVPTSTVTNPTDTEFDDLATIVQDLVNDQKKCGVALEPRTANDAGLIAGIVYGLPG